ncbi:response regulatory protein [Lysinibacillus xylanilyticus]|uniref:Response regulatory protein n=1 Tax=Lysinibacillus xylanilyticus TaxID=582475 RepID=A0A0K9F9T3_9BACI|nr:response regulatory protein [Lysinibacillus xylanilyticus]
MIRVIVMEDEPLALVNMEKKLKEFNSIEVIKSFTTAKDLLAEGPSLDFQVAFLDVEMPGMNGLEIARLLKEWNKNIFIVFVTAYRDYAVQAFEIHSIDYLLKPISKARLETTINRIQELLHLENKSTPLQIRNKPELTIQCFGGFVVLHNNKAVHWRTLKTKELFAFLFSNLNNHVPRDTIIDSLWVDTEFKKARVQLHTTVSYLRTTLSALGYSEVIQYANGSYILQLEDFQCDAHDLEHILNANMETAKIDVEKAEALIQSYQGEYMAALDYPWITSKANFMNNKFTLLLHDLIEHYTAIHDVKKREQILLLTIEHNPYSDKIIQQLIKHYIEVDNRACAVKVYNTFKNTLLADLGILPEQETTELFNAISVENFNL